MSEQSVLRNMVDRSFSRANIIQRCSAAALNEHIAVQLYGNKVLQLTHKAVVKYGVGVTREEAFGQEQAYKLINPKVVRVPKVHDFFEDDSGRGYLVMDYIEGEVKNSISDPSEVYQLSLILDHLASIKSPRPGALGGGPARALIFGESDHPTFKSLQDLENWFNERLLRPDPKFLFHGCELVLCHLDFFLRNIIWVKNRPPCVLDWASAGFFPRTVERCSHLIKLAPESWQIVLSRQISAREESQCDLIMQVWRNVQRYCL